MDKVIKNSVLTSFPELSAGHHLPRTAKVVSVRESPNVTGQFSDKFRPRYAVDVQVLDDHGKPDKSFPVLHDVPLPVQSVGHEAGAFSYPDDGTHVIVQFSNGSPNSPFVSGIMPTNKALPPIARGENLTYHSADNFCGFTKDGSHQRVTTQSITDSSTNRTITAVESQQHFTKSILQIDADSTVTIGGSDIVKVMMNYQRLVGGKFELGAVGGVAITSSANTQLIAPTTWVGSESENVLNLLSELMALVKDLSEKLAAHTHSGVQPGSGTCAVPVQASQIFGVGTDTGSVKDRLDGIKQN